jgi:hypothetical protein
LREPAIEPKVTSPSVNSASTPLIRGPPSARRVAIVLCLPFSKIARTPAANPGAEACTSAQLAMTGHPAGPARRFRVLGPDGFRHR